MNPDTNRLGPQPGACPFAFKKNWNADDDKFLLGLQKRGWASDLMAKRMGVSEAEIEARLIYIESMSAVVPTAPPEAQPQKPLPPALATFAACSQAYSELGLAFQAFATFVSGAPDTESLEKELMAAYSAATGEAISKGQIPPMPATFFATYITTHFICIPKGSHATV